MWLKTTHLLPLIDGKALLTAEREDWGTSPTIRFCRPPSTSNTIGVEPIRNKNHPCYDATNKKVLGKFKDEMDGKIITNFIALRPKMYCLKVFNEQKAEKKAKGVPKLKVKRDLDMKDYEATLHEHIPKNVNFNAIRRKNHQIYSINQSKVGFTSYDNKRYWFNDTDSLPYGHYSLSN